MYVHLIVTVSSDDEHEIIHRLNFRNTHHGRGVPEEASLNQNARGSAGRSGTYTTRSGLSGGADSSHSVQFNVHPDAKVGSVRVHPTTTGVMLMSWYRAAGR